VAIKSPSRVPPGIFTLIFLVCLGLLGFALYLQHLENLDPCPWCIVQRLGFIVIALVCLVAALHRPGRTGTTLYGVLGLLVSAGGIAAAAYHLHIQSDPKRALECMGGWLERWLDASRLGKMVPPLLQYEGSCVLKPWDFLGISIPGWSLVWFVILLMVFIGVVIVSRR
jgi:disulfide bond formation protein DsbB